MKREELCRVLDQVRPFRDREEAMLKSLLHTERTEQKPMKRQKLPRLAAVTAAAALLLTTGAVALVTGLDQRLLAYFGAGPEQEELLSPAAVSVDQVLKSQGTTLHVRQAIADRYSAVVLLDLTAPEGTVLDGNYYALGGGVRATAADGIGLERWGTGWTLLEDEDPGDNRISLLCTVHALEGDFNFLGSRLSLDFGGLYDNNLEKNALTEGRWKCSVTLSDEDPGRYVTMDTPIGIGESRVTLKSVYVSPISLAWELRQGEDPMETVAEAIRGQEDWGELVTLTTEEGGSLPVGKTNFLLTSYTDKGGLYCFRLAEITDPAEVVSVSIFGQSFSLAE